MRGAGLEAGQVNAEAHVRAVGEGEMPAGGWTVEACRVEAVRVGKHRRIAIRGADRDADELAPAYLRVPELDIGGGVAIDDRRGRLEPERLLERRRSSRVRSCSIHASTSGCSSRWSSALAIIPSVVSIPPNSSTAAFETICSVVRSSLRRGGAEQRRLGAGGDHRLQACREGVERLAARAPATRDPRSPR